MSILYVKKLSAEVTFVIKYATVLLSSLHTFKIIFVANVVFNLNFKCQLYISFITAPSANMLSQLSKVITHKTNFQLVCKLLFRATYVYSVIQWLFERCLNAEKDITLCREIFFKLFSAVHKSNISSTLYIFLWKDNFFILVCLHIT